MGMRDECFVMFLRKDVRGLAGVGLGRRLVALKRALDGPAGDLDDDAIGDLHAEGRSLDFDDRADEAAGEEDAAPEDGE